MEETKLIIHNLPNDFTTERLYDLFGSYGEIAEGEFKWGIGFVCYAEADGAEAAFVGMNKTKVDGNPIKIDFPGRKVPVSRLVVKNLPTSEYTMEDLKELCESYGEMTECDYKWGFGFIKFKEEKSVVEAVKALKGKEVVPGKKIFFEIQGPNGEAKSQGGGSGGGDPEDDSERSVHAKIGPVCLFIGNLNEGTTVEEVTEVVEPFGELKKVDLKGNFGFVHFKHPDSCRDALSVLSRKTINGARPRVELAEIKKEGKIFVGNLHEDVNQEELISAFLAHGAVVEYKFVRQFAFFTYDDTADAMRAVKSMNMKKVCGVKVKVTVCHKRGHSGHWAKECPNPQDGGSYGSSHHGRSRSPARRDSNGSSHHGRSRSPARRDSYGYPDVYHRSSRRC